MITASPPPTIIRERVSPVCTTLHQLVVPLAQMNVKNGPILQNIRILESKLGQARHSYLGSGITMYAFQIDQAFSNIIHNIHDVEKALLKSYAAYPQGQNPKVDALRQRVQNVVDLERVMANARAAPFAAVIDNDGVTGIEGSLNDFVGGSRPPQPVPTEAPANPAPPVDADRDPGIASTVPAGFSLRMLKWAGVPELQSLLHREGPALEAQALIAAHDCDGV